MSGGGCGATRLLEDGGGGQGPPRRFCSHANSPGEGPLLSNGSLPPDKRKRSFLLINQTVKNMVLI